MGVTQSPTPRFHSTANCHGNSQIGFPAILVLHSPTHLWATTLEKRQSLEPKVFELGDWYLAKW